MTDQERLATAKGIIEGMITAVDAEWGFAEEEQGHVRWIIQQAESLLGTKHRYGYKGMYDLCNRDYANLHSEKERYKQALEFYADQKNHHPYEGVRESVPGETARKALKGATE